MNKDNLTFSCALQKFFTEYLLKERGLSHNTIRSYRDTFLHILDFFKTVKGGIKAENLNLQDLNKANILAFLDWLESSKGAKITTRNQRCGAVFSFARYMQYVDPIYMEQWNGILSIRLKKGEKGRLDYLTIDGIKQILEQIDSSTKNGRRDLCILSLLYNSGMRSQELIDLTPRSFNFFKPHYVTVTGKGAKTRIIPLDEPIIKLVAKYIEEYGLNKEFSSVHPLFFNHRKVDKSWIGLYYQQVCSKSKN